MARFIIPGALLGVAVFISACGSSASSDEGDNGGAPAKAEFIKRADLICAEMDKAQAEAIEAFLAKRGGTNLTRSLNERMVVEIGLPPVREEVAKLDALPTPGGDEEEIQAFLDEVEDAIDKGEEDPSTMVDPGSIGPFAAASELGREYGFKACAFPL